MKQTILLSLILVVGLTAGSPARADVSQKYAKASQTLLEQGRYAVSEDDLYAALDYFERALVANPKNVAVLVALGRTHEKLGSVGTGLKYYRLALEIEPNNLEALKAQSLAFLKKDAVDRAENNRARLERLCADEGCEALSVVEEAIQKHLSEKLAANNNE